MAWPAVRADDIVRVARTYTGTPWHHDARAKGVGIDCTGLVACTFAELGVPVEDVRGYAFDADNYEAMTSALGYHCDRIDVDSPWKVGDVLVFRSRMMFNHCGIWTGGGMIHAYSSPSIMRVTENPVDDSWMRRVVDVYRYKNVIP